MKGGMKNHKNLRGLVLSGGESRRMGQDKGLIAQDLVAWVNLAGKLLQRVDLPVSIMIREAQQAEYAAKVSPDFELLTDLELSVGGPLKGLLSFHRYYPLQNVLVLPADMPDLTTEVVQGLIEFRELTSDADAWVFEQEMSMQPFPGIYTSRLLAAVLEKVARQELTRFGLLSLLNSAKTARKVFEGPSTIFKNYNYPQDLEPLRPSRPRN